MRKEYGSLQAVDGLSFTVEEGEVLALLGPNGAGKTTTVEILEGHRRRTGGRVEVLGFDPASGGREMRQRVGIVLQEAGLDDDFTPRELVALYRGMYPRRLEVEAVLGLVGLLDKVDSRVKTLSGGQRRRLDLALGLVGDPDLLFLDEPTTGFDPSARRKAWELIEELRSLGKTILLTTHYMDEAEHLADRVAVIVRGRLVAEGTPSDLAAGDRTGSVLSFRLPAGADIGDLPALNGELVRQGIEWQVTTTQPTQALNRLTTWAIDRASRSAPWRSSGPPWRMCTSHWWEERKRRDPMRAEPGVLPGVRSAVTETPTWAELAGSQLGYALRELWRSRLVLVFTFALPLVWLVVIGLLAGNEAVDEATGGRVMQFVTPVAAAMGLLFATYPTLAMSLAEARDKQILKRLRGTPLPMWAYLAGRIGAVIVFALAAVAVMLIVGVVVFDIELLGRTLPATLVTLVVGIVSLSALGMAVGAMSPSTSFAQAFSIGSTVILLFLSGMFTIGAEMPSWVERVGAWFPLSHLSTALQDQFNPFLTGWGWDLSALAVMALWGVGGAGLAGYGLTRIRSAGRGGTVAPGEVTAPRVAVSRVDPPPTARLVAYQARWATRAAWRDAGWVFFAVMMPVGLYALMAAIYGDSGFQPTGREFSFFFAFGIVAYGIGVTAFINMPEAVATARDKGLLKRLRGTPVSMAQYLGGRMASVLWIAFITALLIFAVGVGLFGVDLAPAGIPLALLVVLVGALTLAACGLALAAITPTARAMAAVGLGILLPLAFFSDIFVIGTTTPAWMGVVGSLFPLRHFLYALVHALDPAGAPVAWTNLAVMVAWLVLAGAVAVRKFRWEPD
ncbi:MAG TPA: ABC transporter permease [Acidimicrobiia bacterium]|nr:ABC transporter permease [Acidimicrobiia bacterium]